MTTYGFRIVGPCTGERRLIDWAAAFTAYAVLDERANIEREAYLSAFTFGDDFRLHLESTGSTKGFDGVCWSPWLWFDIDVEDDLECARRDAARPVLLLVERFRLDDDDPLVFYSGSKGFHVGLPTALWGPAPSAMFHRVARRFAESLAALANLAIDTGVYDKVRAFRAPNSRHPKTGRHKRRLSLDELMLWSAATILGQAMTPAPFDVPAPETHCDQAAVDWQAAQQQVEQQTEANLQRRATGNGTATLNRQTLAFIRDGAGTGDRHRLLFSAAANLAEFGCPPGLVNALLTEAALDSGLPPRDVARQIDCGMQHTPPATPKPDRLFPDDHTGGGYYDARL